jgi:hypothetical protein
VLIKRNEFAFFLGKQRWQNRKKHRDTRRGAFWKLLELHFGLHNLDGFLDMMMSLVDVLHGTLLEALSEAVIFFAGDVVVGFVNQLNGAMETAGPIHLGIHGGMVVEILAVVDGCLLDFADSLVDFVNGLLFLLPELAMVGALEMGAGMTEIGQGVKISRMLLGDAGAGAECEEQRKNRCRNCELQERLHILVSPEKRWSLARRVSSGWDGKDRSRFVREKVTPLRTVSLGFQSGMERTSELNFGTGCAAHWEVCRHVRFLVPGLCAPIFLWESHPGNFRERT